VALLTELKDADSYDERGIEVLTLCKAALDRHGAMTRPTGLDVTVQSFHGPTVRRAGAVFDQRVPVALLVGSERAPLLLDRGRLIAIAEFASGIGPEKS